MHFFPIYLFAFLFISLYYCLFFYFSVCCNCVMSMHPYNQVLILIYIELCTRTGLFGAGYLFIQFSLNLIIYNKSLILFDRANNHILFVSIVWLGAIIIDQNRTSFESIWEKTLLGVKVDHPNESEDHFFCLRLG